VFKYKYTGKSVTGPQPQSAEPNTANLRVQDDTTTIEDERVAAMRRRLLKLNKSKASAFGGKQNGV
jgi:hypothetical protein